MFYLAVIVDGKQVRVDRPITPHKNANLYARNHNLASNTSP